MSNFSKICKLCTNWIKLSDKSQENLSWNIKRQVFNRKSKYFVKLKRILKGNTIFIPFIKWSEKNCSKVKSEAQLSSDKLWTGMFHFLSKMKFMMIDWVLCILLKIQAINNKKIKRQIWKYVFKKPKDKIIHNSRILN